MATIRFRSWTAEIECFALELQISRFRCCCCVVAVVVMTLSRRRWTTQHSAAAFSFTFRCWSDQTSLSAINAIGGSECETQWKFKRNKYAIMCTDECSLLTAQQYNTYMDFLIEYIVKWLGIYTKIRMKMKNIWILCNVCALAHKDKTKRNYLFIIHGVTRKCTSSV